MDLQYDNQEFLEGAHQQWYKSYNATSVKMKKHRCSDENT